MIGLPWQWECKSCCHRFLRHLTIPHLTVSVQLGMLGILERENASVLNESLKQLATMTIKAFGEALKKLNIMCPFYLTQNDGTLIR